MKIEKSEMLRYLGYKGQAYGEEIERRIDRAIEICLDSVTPRYIAKKYALARNPLMLFGADLPLLGKDIARHLQDCGGAYIFGATLGFEIEKTVGRLMKEDSALALIVDSAATCAIESYCDDICSELQKQNANQLTWRFSCGYGDFPLSLQPAFARVLEMQKRIGVFVDGESFMMTPQKSVTAVVGIKDIAKKAQGESGQRCNSKCENCGNVNCGFRKV